MENKIFAVAVIAGVVLAQSELFLAVVLLDCLVVLLDSVGFE